MKNKTSKAVVLFLLSFILCPLSFTLSYEGVGKDFVWAQLDMGGACDPYPDVHPGILKFTADVTSITIDPARKLLKLDDNEIFSYPFMVLACKSAPRSLTDSEIRRLRLYLISGGTLWIEDCLAARHTAFDRWVRRTVAQVFPDTGIAQMGRDHPVFRSFFLLRSLGGRSIVHASIEGINWGQRTAVIYSRNDLLGVWMKDAFGKPLYPCIPGGEVQRMNGKKLVLNIIMYSLTGSYKLDAVHQPFIMQKLRARDAMP